MSTQLFCFTLCSASLAIVRQLVKNLSSFSIFLRKRVIWGEEQFFSSILVCSDLVCLLYILGPAALRVVHSALPELNCLSVAIIRPLDRRQLTNDKWVLDILSGFWSNIRNLCWFVERMNINKVVIVFMRWLYLHLYLNPSNLGSHYFQYPFYLVDTTWVVSVT